MTGATVEVVGLTAVYEAEDERVVALDGVDLAAAAGELLAVVGPSGSGKSTLLAVLGGLQRPTSGSVRVGGEDLATMSAGRLLALRRERLSIVVQDSRRNLVAHGTAADNVRFAQGPRRRRAGRRDPAALLTELGLGALVDAPVDRLSGGERQRVAIATGLAIDPEVLLVDEPTSALDGRTRDDVLDLLVEANRRSGATVLLITHDHDVADRADRVVELRDGRIAGAS